MRSSQGVVAEEEAKKGGARPCLELRSACGGASNRQSPTFPRPWRNYCSVRPRGSWPLQLCSHLSGTKVAALLDFLSPSVAISAGVTVVCGFLGGLPELFPLLNNPESFSVCPRGGVQAERGGFSQSE